MGTEPCSSAEPFLIPCNWLVQDSPSREDFPSSTIPVAAANHLLALITVLTLHPLLAFGVRLRHRGPSWDQLPSPLTQRLPLAPGESVLLRAEGCGGLTALPEGGSCPAVTVCHPHRGSTHVVLWSQGQAQPQHGESGVTSVLGWTGLTAGAQGQ